MTSATLISLATPYIGQGAPPGGGGGATMQFLILGLLFAGMWFLIIAPQRKKQKQHDAMVKSLKQGDKVMTSGGIYGSIASVRDDRFVVRIAEDVKIEVAKHAIGSVISGSSDSNEPTKS